jgi:hypothetical protein
MMRFISARRTSGRSRIFGLRDDLRRELEVEVEGIARIAGTGAEWL